MKKDKVYFAHSKMIYDTPYEGKLLNFLRKKYNIICPNRDVGELGDIKPYLKIVDKCKMVICAEYKKYIGRGVYSEVERALKKKKKVLVIRWKGKNLILIPVIGVKVNDEDDWRHRYGKIIVKEKK